MQNIIITLCEHCKTITDNMGDAVSTQNTATVHIICGTFVIIAAIAAVTIILYRLINLWMVNSKAKRERKWAVEDTKREQIAKYREKELDLLKENKENISEKLDSFITELQKP